MKAFKRLLKNFIILSIPLIFICGYTFFKPMNYMSVEYSMWAEEKDAVRGKAMETEPSTLIIGDSRAKSGIIPAELSDDTYNIAIGGATSVEMYYAVNNYLKNHKAPENVMVIFAPYHFCDIDNWEQTQYYNYLSLPELMDAEINAFKYGEEKICYRGFPADLLSFKLRLPNKYMDALYTARFTGNLASNSEKYSSVRADRGYTVFGEEEYNDGVNYETHHPEFDLSKMVDTYYIRTLDLLNEKGINVIIEQAPINEASDEVISAEFRQGFEAYMQGVEERYPGFTVEKTVPVYENKFFGDNNHLNHSGAEKYSKYIRDKYGELFP